MADRSDFKTGQIVGTRMVGVSVTKAAELFGAARSTVLKVVKTFDKEEKRLIKAKLLKKEKAV